MEHAHLLEFCPGDKEFEDVLRVVAVKDIRIGHHLRVIMNDEASIAVAFLVPQEI